MSKQNKNSMQDSVLIKKGLFKEIKMKGITGIFRLHGTKSYSRVYIPKYALEPIRIFIIFLKIKGFNSFSRWLLTTTINEIKRIQSGENEVDLRDWETAKDLFMDFKKAAYKKEFINKE